MKTKQRHSGQSLVEFALIIPIAFFLITGFFDLGRAVFNSSTISNMVREGARYGIIDPNSSTGPYLENIKKINDKSFGIPDVTLTPTVLSCYPGPCSFLGQDLVVTISRIQDEKVKVEAILTFYPITPGISLIFGSLDLKAQSIMLLSPAAR